MFAIGILFFSLLTQECIALVSKYSIKRFRNDVETISMWRLSCNTELSVDRPSEPPKLQKKSLFKSLRMIKSKVYKENIENKEKEVQQKVINDVEVRALERNTQPELNEKEISTSRKNSISKKPPVGLETVPMPETEELEDILSDGADYIERRDVAGVKEFKPSAKFGKATLDEDKIREIQTLIDERFEHKYNREFEQVSGKAAW